MSDIELKPFPFCGGEAKVEKRNGGFQVRCKQCGARGKYVVGNWYNMIKRTEAIDAWNRRVSE